MLDALLRACHHRAVLTAGLGTMAAALTVAAGTTAWTTESVGDRVGALQAHSVPQAFSSPAVMVPDDPDQVPAAKAFLRGKDPQHKVARHVEDVRRSGSYLRVYTDLPEGETNSRSAISLCEWTAEFLREQIGESEPIVFVHAGKSDNGNVVLANKQSADDDCRVGKTR